jgi:hypothetical protein
MAIWHFKFCLLPRLGVERICGKNVDFLPEYRSSGIPIVRDISDFPNYWGKLEDEKILISNIKNVFRTFGKEEKENFPGIIGDPDGDKVMILEDEIEIALDVRNLSYELLDKILAIANAADCVLVVQGSGEIILPRQSLVMEKIEKSNAHTYCRDPVGFLTSTARTAE